MSLQGKRDELLKGSPLYKSIKVSKDDLSQLRDLVGGDTIKLDGYCPDCGKTTTFISSSTIRFTPSTSSPEKSQEKVYEQFKESRRTFTREFKCARDEKHHMVFLFIMQEGAGSEDRLIKVGQYPSPIDLQQLHNKEYQKKVEEILDSEKAEEYKRAIMTYSHELGIGAFVYLRRIFESLVRNTYQRNKNQLNIKEDFKKKDTKEQIKDLKELLPDVVNDNKHLYDVLSKGVHELSKSECLEYFDAVKGMVEYILDQIYHEIKDEEKKEQLERELNEIHRKHN